MRGLFETARNAIQGQKPEGPGGISHTKVRKKSRLQKMSARFLAKKKEIM